jgi:hypothetical protein
LRPYEAAFRARDPNELKVGGEQPGIVTPARREIELPTTEAFVCNMLVIF